MGDLIESALMGGPQTPGQGLGFQYSPPGGMARPGSRGRGGGVEGGLVVGVWDMQVPHEQVVSGNVSMCQGGQHCSGGMRVQLTVAVTHVASKRHRSGFKFPGSCCTDTCSQGPYNVWCPHAPHCKPHWSH